MQKQAKIFDVKAFIEEVRKRLPIWDSTNVNNSDPRKKKRCWEEIHLVVHPNYKDMSRQEKARVAHDIRKRWKNIQQNYKREMDRKRLIDYDPNRSGTPYLDSLSFLEPIILNQKTNSEGNDDVEGEEFQSEPEDAQVLPDSSQPVSSKCGGSKRRAIEKETKSEPSQTGFVCKGIKRKATELNLLQEEEILPESSQSDSLESRETNGKATKSNHLEKEETVFKPSQSGSSESSRTNSKATKPSHLEKEETVFKPSQSGSSESRRTNSETTEPNRVETEQTLPNPPQPGSFESGGPTRESPKGDCIEELTRAVIQSLLQRRAPEVDDDDDKHFLLSLLNATRAVPNHLKLTMRTEMMQVVAKYRDMGAHVSLKSKHPPA
ncbi:uncharacterized protein LOC128894074 [Hylaeus anthracinus]|uniref:uncharacterized protein LOC128894074 n=1 Tax=Hylaeus anthracinus TaxID=313031 RepID=UPI0023B90E3A|nr:uncharacterized protein LOC128894074 [Hylaeus anthracinus]